MTTPASPERLDLDAIRARAWKVVHRRNLAALTVATDQIAAVDVPALVAEVERLREELRVAGAKHYAEVQYLREDVIGPLRTEVAEIGEEDRERNGWADRLAKQLDVPEDMDPYFGIERVATTHARYLDEASAELARVRPVLQAAEAWRDGGLADEDFWYSGATTAVALADAVDSYRSGGVQ